jgi:hypothetical protein
VVGAIVEYIYPTTRACCQELCAAPSGAFHVLHTTHGLCPYSGLHDANIGERFELDILCERPPKVVWDIVWKPCSITSTTSH